MNSNPPLDSPIVEVRALHKTFGFHRVLRGVSFSAHAGECLLLLGANGAGKSTLLRSMAGLSRCDKGEIKHEPPGSVGFASQHLMVYPRLTVQENLQFFSTVAGSKMSETVLSEWGLQRFAHKAVAELSKGNQARVALARTFLHPCSLLLLDEPSANLDEGGCEVLVTAIQRFISANEGAVVLATHDIHRLSKLATRVLVLDGGTVVADTGRSASAEQHEQVVTAYREGNR